MYLGLGDSGYASYNFELVTEEPEYLTPEQVLKALQDDPTKVEVQYGISGEFVSADTVHPITYVNITQGKWRVKPVPKTIDYYGTELPKNITKAEAESEGLTTVYRYRRGLAGVIRTDVLFMSEDRLYFRTKDDAQLVLDTILKPFKQ